MTPTPSVLDLLYQRLSAPKDDLLSIDLAAIRQQRVRDRTKEALAEMSRKVVHLKRISALHKKAQQAIKELRAAESAAARSQHKTARRPSHERRAVADRGRR